MQLTPQKAAQKAARHRSVHNPQYAVKKYRRSAAGGGIIGSLQQLSTNVGSDGCHFGLFVWMYLCASNAAYVRLLVGRQQQHQRVQKDLVTLVGNLIEPTNSNKNNIISSSNDDDDNDATNSVVAAKQRRLKHQRTKQTVRKMQAKMVCYTILASYLLSGTPSSEYEAKFGARALRTLLSCYLKISTALCEEYHHHPTTTTTIQ